MRSLVLSSRKLFQVSSDWGDIDPERKDGLYHADTRFLSTFLVRIQGIDIDWLAVSRHGAGRASMLGAAQDRSARHAGEDYHLALFRERSTGEALRETIRLESFAPDPVRLALELVFDADFADVLEVHGGRPMLSRDVDLLADPDGLGMRFRYVRKQRVWETLVTFSHPLTIEGRQARVEFEVSASNPAELALEVVVSAPTSPGVRAPWPVHEHHGSESGETAIWRSSSPLLDGLLDRSRRDLKALEILVPGFDAPLLAAGLPWFMTVFGRDSLWTALQLLAVYPAFAVNVLRFLAAQQGTKVDDWRDEEPGKILHEIRFGELAKFEEYPHARYFGTADATPLFLVLLAATVQRTGDPRLLEELDRPAMRALDWIDRFGDLDGDGFVEYRCRSPRGLRNQGWKDSWDAIRFRGGQLAEPPIALAEVQAYVYAAKAGMARTWETTRPAVAERLRREAGALRKAFEEKFWLPGEQTYAMALDGSKRPVDGLGSHVGHCLWSRIVAPERARSAGSRLLSPDLFSGFGVRTLARSNGGFNPLGYHTGSVWPHDNAILIAGLMRYGLVGEATRIAEALIQASRTIPGGSLPELFSGFDRTELDVVVAYPASCVPQAWAAGSVYLILDAFMRWDWEAGAASPATPLVPDSFGTVSLTGVTLGGRPWVVEARGQKLLRAEEVR
ncbi:MAG: amylo-alpha-1,6-glucosidase [Candidatus Sericytochromatia bacterium]|nr:amylo-alpha-1,6-glucosidase [Candidatus Tanganyikabacteria bacterium]